MDFVPVNTPLLGERERELVIDCIDTGWISSEGPYVARFEEAVASYVGTDHAVAVSSGSAALEVALAALDVREGDEVIVPTHTIISCVAPIVRAGAVPVYLESELSTWNMDIAELESKISPRTKAIMVVHLYGLPVDMESVLGIARAHDVPVIEDAAQMLGQSINGRPCGSFGDISTFSFYPNKHVTTGEGGMCLMNDPRLMERCRSFRNLCFQERRFVHEELGWNYRLTNMQAALGLAQLEKIDDTIRKKRQIGSWYNDLLADFESLVLPAPSSALAENIYWVYGLVPRSVDRSNVQTLEQLRSLGIGARPFFYPMHLQPVFRREESSRESFPIAERLGESGFYVPSGLGLTQPQAEQVADALRKVFKE